MVTIQDENNPRIILNLGGSILATTLLSVLLLTAYVTVRSGFAISIAQEQNSNLSSSDSALTAGTNTTTTGINSTQVDFASNIEQIRGHVNAAIMNKEAGNNSLAKAHTLHPIAEIYSTIEPSISNINSTLNNTLASDLNQFSQMVNTSSLDEFDKQSQKINRVLNQTIQQIIPSEALSNSSFNLGVASDLLSIAAIEYGEAVENGTIKEIVEYQDGQAFVSRAQNVFSQASPTLSPEMNPNVEETVQFFSALNASIQNKSNPEVVDRSIRAIIHEISEITGINEESLGGQETGTESGEIISEIRSLLNQTIGAYRQQNYEEAEALATTAYLDNFEFIEAPLAEKDEALMQNTELMLREQLRQLIQDHVPIEELQLHIDKINGNLKNAEVLLVVE
ncbi:MAG: hypothetical protein WBM37_12610 [Nitrososphaeraceae archaeon]